MIEFGEKIPGVRYAERSGAYAVLLNGGRIGLVRTSTGYFLPGGGIDDGEAPEETLRREVMEETGHAVTVRQFIGRAGLYDRSPQVGFLHSTGYFYVAELGEQRAAKAAEDHELVWVPAREAGALLHLAHQAWAAGEALRLAT